MEFASSILSSTLSKIGEYLVEPSIPQANFIFRFNNIIEDFKKECEKLRSLRDQVQQEVERATGNDEAIKKVVEKWLEEVQCVLEDIKKLEGEIQAKKTFLYDWCPNWGWQYKLSRRIIKKMSIVLKLRDSGKFESVSHSTTLPNVEAPAALKEESVEAPEEIILFRPTEDALSRIMKALKDDKINMVGLYGMGGLGKTTLAKVVAKKVDEEKLFDQVVMVTISQNPNVKDIQGQMADSLGIKFKEETEEGRAKQLFQLLKEKKRKILIILDDIWATLNLTTIGIPSGDDFKGCTLLLITRQHDVCINMRCELEIQLGILNEEEGMTLFRKHTGINDDSPNFNDAKEVVRECKGLPIAIVTTGKALRGEDIAKWRKVSEKLKMSKLMDVETVNRNVYACLKLSYDYLKGDETKFCFLLCSLFPKDCEISLEELLRFALGLDLFRDAVLNIEGARSQLHIIINNLKASCLLFNATKGFVTMHALVRDLALWIASKGENVFMVKVDMRPTKRPKDEDLEQCTGISLTGSEIGVLPNRLVYPKLKILLLEGSYKKDNEYFKEMKALKVATLRSFTLSINSLLSLTNLVTLQLIHCRLSDMSSLKKLAKLKILILCQFWLFKLPEEIRDLHELRMLDISYCYNLRRIPVNVISSLTRLEELYIGQNSFKAWEIEGTSAKRNNANLSELSKLYRLTILSLSIRVHQRLPKDFVLPSLLKYDIKVNYEKRWEPFPERSLTITDIEGTSLFAFKALYKNVEYLQLEKIMECHENIVPIIDETGLIELKRLFLKHLDKVECIIDMTQQHAPSIAFSNVVYLSLYYVDLREICNGGRPPREFLRNLETLEVESCNKMSCLLPTLLIQSLRKLKEVNIYRCGELQDVFQLEGQENPFLLSSLASLHLGVLPNLRNIWKGPTQKVSLQSLTIIKVDECNNLRYVFTLNLARSLLQLQQLWVLNCDSLEHIIEIKAKETDDNIVAGRGNDVLLPKLTILELRRLKNLINFCSENYSSTWTSSLVAKHGANMQTAKETKILNLPELQELKVSDCKRLRRLLSSTRAQTLQQLKTIDIRDCGELQQLMVEEDGEDLGLFPNLSSIYVSGCEKLKTLFPVATAQVGLQQLRSLEVTKSPKLEEIFGHKDGADKRGDTEIELPQLEELTLEGLESLVNFGPSGYHFIFPSLSRMWVQECPKITTRFSVDQYGSVHAQAESIVQAPHTDSSLLVLCFN